MPDPLPEAIDLSAEAVALLADAEHALGRLSGTTSRLVNPYLVGQPLLRREAILSSRIEGTVTTPEQLALLEAAGDPAVPDARIAADTREVLNYVRAMERGIELLRDLPLCLRLLRETHRVLLDGVRGGTDSPGEFRTVQNWIGQRGRPIGDARFVPPPPADMQSALADFERWMNAPRTGLPLLVRLAMVHYQFEVIHPFRDGNGRIGRLLLPLILIASNRLSEPVLYLSDYLERRRQAYVDHLLAVSTDGAWDDWFRFFLEGIADSAARSLSHAEELLRLHADYHGRVRSARSSGLLAALIDALFRVPSITMAQTARLLEITPAAASHNVRRLVELGILSEATGRRRNQVFVAREIIGVLGRGIGEGPT